MSQAQKYDQDLLKCTTPEARVSHPHVFKPTTMMENGRPKGDPFYSIELLIPKTADIKPLTKAIHHACVAKWGPNKAEWPERLKMPLRDGDKPHGKKKEIKEEHKGHFVVKASSKAEYAPPHVVDAQVNPILNQADFYPGCYARAALKAVAYEVGETIGVKFVLDGVQKIRDGKALGGKKPANQMFGAMESADIDAEPSFDTEEEIAF